MNPRYLAVLAAAGVLLALAVAASRPDLTPLEERLDELVVTVDELEGAVIDGCPQVRTDWVVLCPDGEVLRGGTAGPSTPDAHLVELCEQ